MYLFLVSCWAFVAVQAALQLRGAGFSLLWLRLLQSTGSRALGLQQLHLWAQ